MQLNQQYLVFANKMEYSDSYQKTLMSDEYIVDINYSLYSFSIDDKLNYIDFTEAASYGDIKQYDYFCYSNKQKAFWKKLE